MDINVCTDTVSEDTLRNLPVFPYPKWQDAAFTDRYMHNVQVAMNQIPIISPENIL